MRVLLRLSKGRAPDPTATILDSRTPCNPRRRAALGAVTTGRSARRVRRYTRGGGYPGTPALALHVTPANEHEREHVGELAETVQEATGESVELAHVGTKDIPERGQLRKRRLMA